MLACTLAAAAVGPAHDVRGEARFNSDLEAREEGKRLEAVAALRARQARAVEALAVRESARAREHEREAEAFAATRVEAQRWIQARAKSARARAERSQVLLARAQGARAGETGAEGTAWHASAIDPGAAQAPGTQRRRASEARAGERAALRARAQRRRAAERARGTGARLQAEGAQARKDAEAARAAERALRDALSDDALGVAAEPFEARKGWLEWPVRAGWNDVERTIGRPRAEARVKEDAALGSIGPGRIAWAGPMGGVRRGVIVEHEGGWMSVYMGVDPAREEGEWVEAGETIGIAQRGAREDGTTVVGLEILREGVGKTPFGWMRDDESGRGQSRGNHHRRAGGGPR